MQAFIKAANREEIIFTKGTTESINLVAFSFGEAFIGEGDEIIVSEMEHHANIRITSYNVCYTKLLRA